MTSKPEEIDLSEYSPDIDINEPVEYIFAPIGQEDSYGGDEMPPLHARRDVIPVYDINRSIPGHFLWNKGYGVLRRRMHLHANVQANSMLQHIVSVTNNACVSLLFPEAQLFPRIFWYSQDSSIVGSIPSFMLNCFFNDCDHGIAPLNQHHAIRMRDGDILTSKENVYWHYLFDITLNQQLNRCSSKLVLKRGLEFLLENEYTSLTDSEWHGQQSVLPMNESDSTRRIKELASLLKKDPWTYFLTLTVNETHTPGVKQITQAITDFAGSDENKLYDLTQAYLPFILRIWERFVRFFFQELILRNSSILGRVKHIFYRFEFQEAGSEGNPPHVHAGITLYEEAKEISVGRICCLFESFSSVECGTDLRNLLDLGVVSDEKDFNSWREIYSYVNRHNCEQAGQRCKKAVNAEGEKICRYRRQPQHPITEFKEWFVNVEPPYSDEIYQLLQEMGLAEKSESDKWILHESLATGKWHYPACQLPEEHFIASIPMVSAITRSATNVDMCDRHFQVSYILTKCFHLAPLSLFNLVQSIVSM